MGKLVEHGVVEKQSGRLHIKGRNELSSNLGIATIRQVEQQMIL
jgi:hypothetical protein